MNILALTGNIGETGTVTTQGVLDWSISDRGRSEVKPQGGSIELTSIPWGGYAGEASPIIPHGDRYSQKICGAASPDLLTMLLAWLLCFTCKKTDSIVKSELCIIILSQ